MIKMVGYLQCDKTGDSRKLCIFSRSNMKKQLHKFNRIPAKFWGKIATVLNTFIPLYTAYTLL